MHLIDEYTKQKGYRRSLVTRLRRIMKEENSFILGMSETIMNNFDVIFRYLYAAAFLLLISVEYLYQRSVSSGFSFLAAAIVITLLFIIAMTIIIINYRTRYSNIDVKKAILFYLKFKCFTSKSILENYE